MVEIPIQDFDVIKYNVSMAQETIKDLLLSILNDAINAVGERDYIKLNALLSMAEKVKDIGLRLKEIEYRINEVED